jgi:hypothetical protein
LIFQPGKTRVVGFFQFLIDIFVLAMTTFVRGVIAVSVVVCVTLAGSETFAQAPTQVQAGCSMMRADVASIGGSPARTLPVLRSISGSRAIIIASVKAGDATRLNVNSDGSPRAYHLLDPEGRKYALNDMYSGGTRVFDGDEEIVWCSALSDEQRRNAQARYYAVFRRFVSENRNFGVTESTYDPKQDSSYTVGDDFGNGLDPPPPPGQPLGNAFFSLEDLFGSTEPEVCPAKRSQSLDGYNCQRCTSNTNKCRVCFKRSIIKSDSSNRLCIRDTGRYKGFLVNSTSLDKFAANPPDPENSEDRKCGVPVNVDPEKLPGVVLPAGKLVPRGDSTLVAGRGDIVIAYNPASDKYVFGVVSDAGPKGKFGEASIAFNRTLRRGYKAGALSARPVSYRPDLLNSAFQPSRPIPMLILPGTMQRFRKPGLTGNKAFDFSPATVARVAKSGLLEWARTRDIDVARRKLQACINGLPN